jgi:Xaa-Pro aminopeptidase/Xaa-Pro dipeptidase
MGARYRGYCSDRSEVYFVGVPTKKQQRVYDAVLKAKNAAELYVKEGVRTAEIDRIARDVLRSYELESFFTHALGHGVGIDIHEGVTVSSRSRDSLVSGDVITIEPGVYIPGSFGIRLENTLFVA